MQNLPQNPPPGPVLRDLHLPGEPHWFPPAPGWWLLAVVTLAALLYAFRWWRRQRRRRYRAGAARREWLVLQQRYAEGADVDQCLRELSALVKRAALRVDPAVAQLHGSPWARWLDAQLGRSAFADGPGRTLIDAPYRPQPPGDLSALLTLCGELISALERRL